MNKAQATYDGEFGSVSSLFEAIAEGADAANRQLRVLLISSKEDLSEYIQTWQRDPYDAKVTASSPGFLVELGKNEQTLLQARVVKLPEHPQVYAVISDSKGHSFKKFADFIDRHFPHISRIFLTDNDMYQIFHRISQGGYDVNIAYASCKVRLHSGKKESSQTHTAKPYVQFFSESEDRNQSINIVKYAATTNDNQGVHSFTGSISRDCKIVMRGNFKGLAEKIIPHMLELVSERNAHLKASAESASSDIRKPITLKFEGDIFADPKDNHDYLDRLVSLPKTSISVYHENPYIHASLVDHLDGSSYDVWVLAPDEMSFVPQISATSASMRRIVNHVFEKISKGTVMEYKARELEI